MDAKAFRSAKQKTVEARKKIEAMMRTRDHTAFAELWSEFLTSNHKGFDRLGIALKNGKGNKWFYDAIKVRMDDELMRYALRCGATIWVRTRIASLNFVPKAFLCVLRQVMRCRASRSCSFLHGSPTAARADAVKVGRRSDLDAGFAVDRPRLDGGEHDAMLGPAGWTWGRDRESRGGSTADKTRWLVLRHRRHPDFGRTRAHVPERYARSSAFVAPCARGRLDIRQDAWLAIDRATVGRTMTDRPRTTPAAHP